ncbi:MAG: hypothetical protein ACLFU8_05615 [Anaerolineales bacterium]
MNDPDIQQQLTHVLSVKRKYERWFLEKSHVVGVGVGLRHLEHTRSDHVVIIVNVSRKVPCEKLSPEDRIPAEVEGVPVEVETVGEFRAQADNDDEPYWEADSSDDDDERPIEYFSAP